MSQHCAEGAIPGDALRKHLIAGEISLDGSLKPVRGVLSQGLLARRLGLAGIMVPAANAAEARLVPGIDILPASTLRGAVSTLSGEAAPCAESPGTRFPDSDEASSPDLRDVVGQPVARRALEIAAAGSHALLLVGPPGCGKTMLAERIPIPTAMMDGFPPSTPSPRNLLFTPKKPVVCTGFAVRSDFGPVNPRKPSRSLPVMLSSQDSIPRQAQPVP